MKLVIDRKKWGRGELFGMLLNDAGKMCCLGFLGLACGLPENVIRDVAMPANVFGKSAKRNNDKWAKMINRGGGDDSTRLAKSLAVINDNTNTSDKQKERKITQKFKTIGVDVKFKN